MLLISDDDTHFIDLYSKNRIICINVWFILILLAHLQIHTHCFVVILNTTALFMHDNQTFPVRQQPQHLVTYTDNAFCSVIYIFSFLGESEKWISWHQDQVLQLFKCHIITT
jgi:hypothetical protein